MTGLLRLGGRAAGLVEGVGAAAPPPLGTPLAFTVGLSRSAVNAGDVFSVVMVVHTDAPPSVDRVVSINGDVDLASTFELVSWTSSYTDGHAFEGLSWSGR